MELQQEDLTTSLSVRPSTTPLHCMAHVGLCMSKVMWYGIVQSFLHSAQRQFLRHCVAMQRDSATVALAARALRTLLLYVPLAEFVGQSQKQCCKTLLYSENLPCSLLLLACRMVISIALCKKAKMHTALTRPLCLCADDDKNEDDCAESPPAHLHHGLRPWAHTTPG